MVVNSNKNIHIWTYFLFFFFLGSIAVITYHPAGQHRCFALWNSPYASNIGFQFYPYAHSPIGPNSNGYYRTYEDEKWGEKKVKKDKSPTCNTPYVTRFFFGGAKADVSSSYLDGFRQIEARSNPCATPHHNPLFSFFLVTTILCFNF